MKKGLLFLVLFFLIFVGVYLYKKSPRLVPEKNLFQNQTPVSPSTEKEKKLPTAEVSQELILEVNQPKDKSTVNSSTITVSGKTSPGADVFINDKELKADSQGEFDTTLNLDEGENIITVVASDGQGNFSEKELTVFFETVE